MSAVLAIAARRRRIAALSPTDLALYRGPTLGLLRRYFRLSVEIGRLPSLLGRECFRARLTSYRAQSFEDVVIFVHDLERCLERLDDFSQKLVMRVVFQEFTLEEAAQLIGCGLRTIKRRFPEVLDQVSRVLLERGLLPLLVLHAGKTCQEVKNVEIAATG